MIARCEIGSVSIEIEWSREDGATPEQFEQMVTRIADSVDASRERGAADAARAHRALDFAERMERDRAELLAAVKQIAASRDTGRHDGLPEDGPALEDGAMWAIARAAIEKVEEGD